MRIWQLISCIRFREVLILQGAPAMGGILAMGQPTVEKGVHGAIFIVANICLVAHMWSLNDWADRHADEANDTRSHQVFTRKGVAPTAMVCLSLGLLGVGLVLFAWLSATAFWIAVSLAWLSFLYSFPGLHAKSIPMLSSVLHLAGGFLHFLLGYSLYAVVDPMAMLVAVAFALVFTAGHGVQEVQDHDADRRAGVRTNAVVFGKSLVFGTTLVAFLFVYGCLSCLAVANVLPSRVGPPTLVLAALHLYCAGRAFRRQLSFTSIRRYRGRYRAIFALLGLNVVSVLFF